MRVYTWLLSSPAAVVGEGRCGRRHRIRSRATTVHGCGSPSPEICRAPALAAAARRPPIPARLRQGRNAFARRIAGERTNTAGAVPVKTSGCGYRAVLARNDGAVPGGDDARRAPSISGKPFAVQGRDVPKSLLWAVPPARRAWRQTRVAGPAYGDAFRARSRNHVGFGAREAASQPPPFVASSPPLEVRTGVRTQCALPGIPGAPDPLNRFRSTTRARMGAAGIEPATSRV